MLNEKQQKGLEIAINRYNKGEKYTVIAGYAGTGKSYLVKHIISALELKDSEVCFATFCGKAAQVLINRGNKNAKTLHKLLYKAKQLPNGGFIFQPVSKIEYKLVVVDEMSMCPKSMIELLLKYNCHIIMLGDPFQLPPVNKKDKHDYLDNPHIFLDEIMRQEEGNGIIELSMRIRTNIPYRDFTSEQTLLLQKQMLSIDMLKWADIVICSTNKTRINLNNAIRKSLGYINYLEENDKLINLNNDWDMVSVNNNPLTNGCIGYFSNFFETTEEVPAFYNILNNKIEYIIGDFLTENGDFFPHLMIDKKCLLTGEPTLSPRNKYLLHRAKRDDLIPHEMAYGYAITGHRSQGSEWNKVLIVEESFPYEEEEHCRWLYTTCTRSSEQLILVKK